MGKYTKYSSNYPTKYAKWMYPPKNVGFLQFISMNLQGLYKTNKGDWRSQWSYGVAALAVTYAWFKVSVASSMMDHL